jgi:hypothetical protein
MLAERIARPGDRAGDDDIVVHGKWLAVGSLVYAGSVRATANE